MQKAKPKKKKKIKTREELIEVANYLHFAIDTRTLLTVNGMTHEQVDEFIESKVIMLAEVHDKRSSVMDIIGDTKELTGYDTIARLKAILTRLYG